MEKNRTNEQGVTIEVEETGSEFSSLWNISPSDDDELMMAQEEQTINSFSATESLSIPSSVSSPRDDTPFSSSASSSASSSSSSTSEISSETSSSAFDILAQQIEQTDTFVAPSAAPSGSTKPTTRTRRQRGTKDVAGGRSSLLEDRKLRKKEQNKNAATRYRQKKKLEMEHVANEEQELLERNQELQLQYEEYLREEKYLKKLIREMYGDLAEEGQEN